MNELTTVAASARSNELCSNATIVKALEEVRRFRPRWTEFPIVPPEVRQLIPAAIEEVERSLTPATESQIVEALAMLEFALPVGRNMPEVSADARAAIYLKALSDVPADILNAACMDAVKTLKFFPKVAELRELAAPEIGRRQWARMTLKRMAEVHDEHYRPSLTEKEMVKPEDLAKLAKRLGGRFKSKRAAA